MTGALAWTGRLIFLVLAMLATLSIIGSIAAIPSGLAEQRPGIERPRTTPAEVPAADRRVPVPAPERASQPADGPPATTVGEVIASAPPERDDPLLWLEPLTYALLALAGLMAIGVLLLWRAVVALEGRRG